MTVWFTSDLHLGHQKVAQERGFDDPDAHDVAIYDSLESTLKRGDQLWILGDMTVGGSAAEAAALFGLGAIAAPAHGIELHLIAGNHDSCHPMANRNSHNRQRAFLETFTSVQLFARRRIAGQPVMSSHFPYRGDHSPQDRGVQYRLPDLGEYVLHGHTHSPSVGTGKQIHVGWDAWHGLVELDEIAALIEDDQAQL
ncbi:metallophosphoesterase [Rhodococcus sp. MALMAid1271]|uniref:metallophosphoesterase n=1 Tax=Rhodococcus sp. MALMAid1271 TaxID=3411744 RepID=UPI003BA3D107